MQTTGSQELLVATAIDPHQSAPMQTNQTKTYFTDASAAAANWRCNLHANG